MRPEARKLIARHLIDARVHAMRAEELARRITRTADTPLPDRIRDVRRDMTRLAMELRGAVIYDAEPDR